MTEELDFFSPPVRPQKPKRGPKPNPNRVRLIPVSFKMTEEAHARMLVKARKHSGGNVSEWLRDAATNYSGKK